MDVRRARKEDMPALLALEEEYTESDETFAELTARFEKWPELFVVAVEGDTGDTIVGEASGIAKSGRVTLSAIVVTHRLQRRGIGRRLLALFESGASHYGRVEGARVRGEHTLFYVEDVAYAPGFKAKVKSAFHAVAVNYIFEKQLPLHP